MDRRFGQVDQRFAQMDTRFDDLRDVLSHTFAVSTTNNLKSQQHDQLYQFSEGEQQRLTQRVDDLAGSSPPPLCPPRPPPPITPPTRAPPAPIVALARYALPV
jgi:hypothetical protein